MAKRKTRKEKKRLVLISLVNICLLIALVWSVTGKFKIIMENKKNTSILQNEYEELLDEEDKLKSEIIKMQDPEYIARYAKEKYLYSSDGELIIRID